MEAWTETSGSLSRGEYEILEKISVAKSIIEQEIWPKDYDEINHNKHRRRNMKHDQAT